MVQCVALDMMEQFELASIKGQTDGYPFACLGADVLFCVVFFFLIAVTQYTTMGDVWQGSAAFPVFFSTWESMFLGSRNSLVCSSTESLSWWEDKIWEEELLNGKIVMSCIYWMLFWGFKLDDPTLRAVLNSVEAKFGDWWLGGCFFFCSFLSLAILLVKVLAFKTNCPQLLLSREGWAPPLHG